ncbi:HlyD family type I secretion membrane fusion protein [Rhizobium sp. PP-F2F-G48]|uniref:HlyD family type I secretion periplasmic adaptor subunit n=1 Tax=Rhizobium sp. PP-F2F-G48 TaxID=2135651 RepID=UPI001042CE18|nr:HlyD family type I secretion periplasmic adaptor subunit [Rhizobium sp. PP-F2F-G48]TCM51051.1 HlyD family type I secretion membrane fusion protein [Rhizobium sp. PP-F2F-G48]
MSKDQIGPPASPTIRLTAWLLVFIVLVTTAGSYVATTEIVARGQGKVIPSGRVQAVQPLLDGKVTKILVTEGQFVRAGDLLVTIDTAAVESQIKRIEANRERQRQDAAVARSIVEPLANDDPTSPGFVEAGKAVFRREHSENRPQAREAEALIVAVLSALRDQVEEAGAQLNRVKENQATQRARLDKIRADQEIIGAKFQSTQRLRKGGTLSEFDYLERLRELKAVEGEGLVAQHELDGLAAEVKVLASQRASVISMALSTYRKQLNEADITLQSLKAELNAANSQLEGLSLKAPVSGRVEGLSVFTVGGFVEAGSTLMSIVPSGDDIEIEAFFDNRDVGFLEVSQKAFVKFDAFPAERFGIVRGRVTNVGADARDNVDTGKWVYAVRLRLEQTGINLTGRHMKFVPGMTATIDVVTGERRLISYFFEPIVKALQDSFGER